MKRILFTLVLMALLLSACGGGSSTPKVTDPQTPIQASAGNQFQIVLEANPTTGYHWDIVGELDKSVVELVSHDYQSASYPNVVGGGGLDTWTFKAVGAGQATITLGYYPPSNTPTDPAKTETFTVQVK